ncbi:formyltetrahydrofolate deformylase [Fretibacter rubidus]|uniref:formyltetrahydrofolate deformylase n=1 Tax=Fretibacter rubidus TaxID=570162 RepID=UPI00352AB0BE
MTSKYILTTQSEDRIGIVATLTRALADHGGFITAHSQFGTPGSDRFYSRIAFDMDSENLTAFKSALLKIAGEWSLSVEIIPQARKTKTIIMVSKFDHCLADLLYRRSNGSLNIDVCAVVSNHTDAAHRARAADVPFIHIPVSKTNKPEAEAALRKVMTDTGAELIILARYMQILSDSFCTDYSGRIINIHHSFLPSFKGAKPYHRAYARGVKLIGATAHYVTADLDEGPIIDQDVRRVDHTMTPDQLIAIGRDVEAQTLARAVAHHVDHRAFINGNKTVVLP